MSGKPAARLGDNHTCPLSDGDDPHVGGPVTAGCPTVLIAGQPAARVGDPTLCKGVGATDPIARGEPSVLIGGQDAARLGDPTQHGGKLVQGCANVLIGADDGIADCPDKNCPLKGSPVNTLLGIKVLPPETDFELPSPLGWSWFRFYSSDVARAGFFGPGWNHPAALAVEIAVDTVLVDTQGRNIRFAGRLAPGETRYSRSEGLWLARGGGAAAPTGHWHGLDRADWADAERYFLTDGAGQFFLFWAPPDTRRPGEKGVARPPAAARYALDALAGRTGTVVRYLWREDRLEHVTDSTGRTYRFHYERFRRAHPEDTGDRLVRITLAADPLWGRAPQTLVTYRYNDGGDLVEVLDRHGRSVRRFAWRNHVMVAHEGLGRPAVRYEYDEYTPAGRVLRQVQTEGLAYAFDYRPGHTVVTDNLGRQERYWRCGEGGLTRLARHDRADGSVLLQHYDRQGRPTASYAGRLPLAELPPEALAHPERHPDRFHTTRYQRNAAGRLTVQDAQGLVTRYHWNAQGALEALTDPAGATTRYVHDRLGRLVAHTDPSGRRTEYQYDDPPEGPPAVRPARIVDARGGIKRLTWDDAGQLVAYTDCSGHKTLYTHDPWGQLLEVEDALGQRTELVRDRLGRVATLRDAAGQVTRYTYDEADRLVAVEDALGQVHRQAFDPAGRLVAHQPEGNEATRLQYDAAGRLVTLLAPGIRPHRLEYDALDRLLRETTPDGRTLVYHYDALGQLVARNDGGLLVRHDYDAAGRLVARQLPATAAAPAETHRYQWAGTWLAEAHTTAHSLFFTYDPAGRLATETLRPPGEAPAHALPGRRDPDARTIIHQYGFLGTRAVTRLPNDLELGQLTYGSGHVHQMRVNDQVLADIEHDALHRPVRLRYRYRGPAECYEYDPVGRLTALTLEPPTGADTAPLAHWRFAYDRLGRLAVREGSDGRRRYHYDAPGRLVGEEGTHTARYRFDAAGNRLSLAPQLPAGLSAAGPQDWAAIVRANLDDPDFNVLGGPSSYPTTAPATASAGCPDNRLRELDGTTWQYDPWGNVVERRSPDGTRLALAYDAEHRLVRLDHFRGDRLTHGATYTYDAFGRRRTKSLYLPEHGTLALRQQARFDWDGDRLLGERLSTRSGRDTGRDGDGWHHTERVFVYRPDSFAPLAQIRCTPHKNGRATIQDIAWFQTDHLGTPVSLMDLQGRRLWKVKLDAWGKRVDADPAPSDSSYAFSGATDPNEPPIRLPGQYHDAESGLHYNRHRYYDCHTARYVTQDPIGVNGGPNLYSYVEGNPLRYSDPLGLVKITGIPGAEGETSIHANPGPNATDFRPEHGPDHVHLGKNDGPRVRTSDFQPFSDDDAKKLTRKQRQFCERLGEESKDLIRKRQRQIFQHGRILLQLQGGGLLSIAAACRADPGWCLDQIESGVLP